MYVDLQSLGSVDCTLHIGAFINVVRQYRQHFQWCNKSRTVESFYAVRCSCDSQQQQKSVLQMQFVYEAF